MTENETDSAAEPERESEKPAKKGKKRPVEIGGPKGREPTRYGDWEKNGRAIDF